VQQTILARTFQRAGYRVSIVTLDFGQGDHVVLNGVDVYSAFKPDIGLRFLRFLHPRLTSIWAAMRRADADCYYQRCCGHLTGVVAYFCRRYGRRFIFSGAHDSDFQPALPLLELVHERWFYRYGIRNAHAIVAQNEYQMQACREHYGRDPTLVRNCYELPEGAGANPEGYVLWVAAMRDWKRPELFLKLAQLLPDVRFRMIGGPEPGAKGAHRHAALRKEADKLSNLDWMGAVPYSEIDPHFNGARVFVNTSTSEGFPNTFLQAWARGIPTVSFFDTGSRFDGKSVVCRVDDLQSMANMVRRLMEDQPFWKLQGALSRSCFIEQHSPASALKGYEAVLDRLRYGR